MRLLEHAAAGLLAITLISLIVGTAGLIWLRVRGENLLSVQTASMAPSLKPGDAVIIRPAAWRELRPGDIVGYRSPRDPNLVISHRLIRVDRRTGQLITAGDALRAEDPAFSSTLLIGRATAVLPKFGLVLAALRQPPGLALALYLPAAAVIAAETRRLARVYARPFYSARL